MQGASDEQVKQAEQKLELQFSGEYCEYLTAFGVVSVYGHEFTGICIFSRCATSDSVGMEFNMKLYVFFLLIIVLRYYLLYRHIKKSGYLIVSGNNFFQTAFNKGIYGEFLTYEKLRMLPGENIILTNLYIPKYDGTTTEIDLIMISEKGIFVIESKNYSGWIFGNERSKMWTQTLRRGEKNKFYNPIWQNKGHISALKNFLGNWYSNQTQSYIVFSERCTLKDVTVISPNVHVVKRENLLYELRTNHWKSALTQKDIDLVYQALISQTRVDKTVKTRHVENIHR